MQKRNNHVHTKSSSSYDRVTVYFFIIFGVVLFLLSIFLLSHFFEKPSSVSRLLASNTLRLGVLESRTNIHATQRPQSLQILQELANQFNWTVSTSEYSSAYEVFKALNEDKIDLVADTVIDHKTPYDIRYSRSYQQSRPSIVFFPEVSSKVRAIEDFTNNQLLVIQNSWQSHFIESLSYVYKDLIWQEFPEFWELEDMIQTIEVPPAGYLLLLTQEMEYYKNTYPQLEKSLQFEPVSLAFAFDYANTSLEEFVSVFIANRENKEQRAKQSNVVALLPNLRLGQLKTFLTNVKQRLPRYIHLFVAASEAYGVDWRLITAIAYQESLWDEKAVSPTGVKGLMMLTNATAKFVGIEDRVDPWQSVDGGTRYILYLKELLPERISEPDRTWLALAAYNIGPAHLEDVRVITQQRGGNPDLWADVRQNIALIEQPVWYKKSKRGFARGREARTYVDNIRKYYEVLLSLSLQAIITDQTTDTNEEQNIFAKIGASSTTSIILPKRISIRY